MLPIRYETYLILILFLLLLIVTLRLYILKNKSGKSAKYLDEALNKLQTLESKLTQLEEERKLKKGFDENLNEAEITTKLQKSRLNNHAGQSKGESPERYRYIRTLIEKGMDSEEIAKVLDISLQEAMQLVKLSLLSVKR